YRGKRNLRQIGNDLRVSHALEGSVRRSGTHLRINAQLINTRTDTHIWAEQYDRDLNELFGIQNEIAQKVAQHLHAKLSASEKASVEEAPTQDLVAYDFYVRAVSMIYNAQVPLGVDPPERALPEAVDLLNNLRRNARHLRMEVGIRSEPELHASNRTGDQQHQDHQHLDPRLGPNRPRCHHRRIHRDWNGLENSRDPWARSDAHEF